MLKCVFYLKFKKTLKTFLRGPFLGDYICCFRLCQGRHVDGHN